MFRIYNGHLVQVLEESGAMAYVMDAFGNTFNVLSNLLG